MTTPGKDKFAPKPRKISQVVLVGSATRIPSVREFVFKLTGVEPCNWVNPEECVALGAAIQVRKLRLQKCTFREHSLPSLPTSLALSPPAQQGPLGATGPTNGLALHPPAGGRAAWVASSPFFAPVRSRKASWVHDHAALWRVGP